MLHLTMMMHMKCMQFLIDHIASVNMKLIPFLCVIFVKRI